MSKKVCILGLFVSVALVLSYFEQFIPLLTSIPGVKIGLSNIVVLITLYVMNTKYAFLVIVSKVLLASLMFAGFSSFLYSFMGALISFFAMSICKKLKQFSIIGVSVVGAIFHNFGQILVASILLKTVDIFYYLPYLLISGVITGVFIGIVSDKIIPIIKNMTKGNIS